MFQDSQNEKWKGQLQEIERKRTELLPEPPEDAEEVSDVAEFAGQEEEFSRRSLVLCDERNAERSVKNWRKERLRFATLLQKSRVTCRMAADDLEDEIKILQAGEERRGSCAVQRMLL